MNQPVHGSTNMMPYEVVFDQKPWGDNTLVSPVEAEKFTLADIVDEMGEIPETNDDKFYGYYANTPLGRHNLQNTPVFEDYSNYPRKKKKII